MNRAKRPRRKSNLPEAVSAKALPASADPRGNPALYPRIGRGDDGEVNALLVAIADRVPAAVVAYARSLLPDEAPAATRADPAFTLAVLGAGYESEGPPIAPLHLATALAVGFFHGFGAVTRAAGWHSAEAWSESDCAERFRADGLQGEWAEPLRRGFAAGRGEAMRRHSLPGGQGQ